MLNITPGNDMLYVATRSASQGVKAGIVSALGIAGGCLVHLLAAVIGLSAITVSFLCENSCKQTLPINKQINIFFISFSVR